MSISTTLAHKDFTIAKKVTSSGALPDDSLDQEFNAYTTASPLYLNFVLNAKKLYC